MQAQFQYKMISWSGPKFNFNTILNLQFEHPKTKLVNIDFHINVEDIMFLKQQRKSKPNP